jgi:asparagine synthase (glutamine-hydrolysing)
MEWQRQLEREFEHLLWGIPDRSGIIFSGGLDSSFLAYLINMSDRDVRLYSVGTENSHDFSWTREAADILGLPLKFYILKDTDIINGIREIKKIGGNLDPVSTLIEIPTYYACKFAYDHFLVSGQGADELFLGYKKYETVNSSEADLKRVLESEVPLERKIAGKWGKEIIYPYLEDGIVRIASQIPPELKMLGNQRKYVLRKIAADFGLSDRISWKPKKAAQYSSGIVKAARAIASSQGKKVHELINDL